MKNILIKIATGIVITLSAYTSAKAQYLLKNKLVLSIDYGYAKGINISDINYDGVIIPSVLGYMEKTPGLSFSSKYKINKLFGISLTASSYNFDQWNGMDYSNIHESTKMNIYSIKPGFFLSSPFEDSGIFNRLSFNLTVGPAVEFTKLNLGKSFPWINPINRTTSISDNALGLFSGLYVHYAVCQLLDVQLFYEIEKYWDTTMCISGNGMLIQYYGVGFGFRLITDKYQLYE